MKHGFYNATEYLFKDWFIKNKVDIVENVRASVNYLKKEIDRTFTLANNFKKKQKYSLFIADSRPSSSGARTTPTSSSM